MKQKTFQYYVGDFETTVYKGQQYTEVWASAVVKLGTEDVIIHNNIDDTFNYLSQLPENVCIYYHNLKFDGAFWLYYLLVNKQFKQAAITNPELTKVKFLDDKRMRNKTFKYVISDLGQWYSITIKVNNKFIIIKDSLKLLPFSVDRIGKSFETKHKKLSMEYEGMRYAGCLITDEEKEYIKNDVLVVKEALEIMFNEGHNKLTIGSCCLSEFKKGYDKSEYNGLFPDLTLNSPPFNIDVKDTDSYIRRAYKGGWCYVVKGKEAQIKNNGFVADVNSLYPSMMSSESGNKYPVGLPTFWQGNYIPKQAQLENKYFFIRIKTRFNIKKNKLPFIQIKNNLRFKENECLESSDIIVDDVRYKKYIDLNGEVTDTRVILTLTCTDYNLLLEHYNLQGCEILDGCYFDTRVGLFDDYINKYKQIKMNSKGAKRELAKLFLNNLYGKMATSTKSSFKYAVVKDRKVCYITVQEYEKKVGYIPIGAAITSYARNFTIRAAQANYYGVTQKGFIYADTDSIHCDIPLDKVKNIKIDDNNFCCWKIEAKWDKAIFVRQKTYIEHSPENDFHNVKCAGMPDKCKQLLIMSITQDYDLTKLNEEEREFVKTKRTYKDFKLGLKIPSKLVQKSIIGGVVLNNTTYEMR